MEDTKYFKELTIEQQKLVTLNLNTKFGRDIAFGSGEYIVYEAELINEALEIITAIQSKRDSISEIAVGDYVLLENGIYREVAAVYQNEIQLADGDGHRSYISTNGRSSYSGALEPGIEKKFTLSKERKSGLSWSFLFGSGANMGVYFDMDYKVWKKGE